MKSKDLFSSFISTLFWWIGAVSILSGFSIYQASPQVILAVFLILTSLAAYYAGSQTIKSTINDLTREKNLEISKFQILVSETEKIKNSALEETKLWKQLLMERTSGFPSLLVRIQEYEKLKDEKLSNFLSTKSHPAYKAANLVRVETQKRREANFIRKRTEAIIEYYEYLAPFLLDIKDDVSIDLDQEGIFDDYTDNEEEDPVTKYLTKEEYRGLPSSERNQLALDRFWKRPNKSKWLIGKMYERYIGYVYEMKGYNVEYHGIQKKLEDLGIDLICKKGRETLLVQCKNWSQFKTIYEKHIFQLFGTSFQYADSHPKEHITAVFITTTNLSEIAKKFANKLKIELVENCKFNQNYPCIKCNINIATGEKIYHLPFDQQYDKTKISEPGEMYLLTAQNAEQAGFRRAFRWHASKK